MAGSALRFQVNAVNPAGKPAFVRVRLRTTMAPEIVRQLRVGDSDATTPVYPDAWIGRVESVGGADVILRVPAQQLLDGWRYRNQWLKVGGVLRFETPATIVTGTIVDADAGRSAGLVRSQPVRDRRISRRSSRPCLAREHRRPFRLLRWSRPVVCLDIVGVGTERVGGCRRLANPSAAQRVRMVALTGATAMLVHRAMSRLGPAEPLGAVVPFLVIVACALAALLAGPIARAVERLER